MKIPPIFQEVIQEDVRGVWHAGNLIGGEWLKETSGQELLVTSPVDGRAVARLLKASPEDVNLAVAAAEAAQPRVREIAAIDRIALFGRVQRLLEEHQDFFKFLLLWEGGKPAHEALGEIAATLERLHMTMQEAKKITGE